MSNLVPELRYEVRKIPFNSLDTMVEVACRIEDVLKEKEFWQNQQIITIAKTTTVIMEIRTKTIIGIRINMLSMMVLLTRPNLRMKSLIFLK